jgi:hypothetical protein
MALLLNKIYMKTEEENLMKIPLANSSWDSISNYALTHNGYEHKANLADFANEASVQFCKNKEILGSYTITDLRDCLFFEQRRFRFYVWAPQGEDLEYIKALVHEIREKTIESILGSRNIYKPMIELFIGGYAGKNHKLVSDGNMVFFYKEDTPLWREENKRIFIPSQKKWETFWSFIDSIVLQWNLEYLNSGVCDGTQWELTLNRGKLQMKYFGSNAFPEDFGEFLKTVSMNLIGGLKIY